MNKTRWSVLVACAVGLALYLTLRDRETKEDSGTRITGEATVTRGAIQRGIDSTGIVQPQNRLEVRPSMAGRLDQLLVEEGQRVSKGQTVAWMSSTERASLLDAARVRGEQDMAYWEQVYKPAPLIAPIDGTIIVCTLKPGQPVGASEAVVVIADRLIVRAQVDETDIGKVSTGLAVVVTLDAYQETKVNGRIDRIAYESKTVNNVTTYELEVTLDETPDFFRAGMSATVQIVQERNENALLLPVSAVQQTGEGVVAYVAGKGGQPEAVAVTVGMSDRQNTEILSGLSEGQTVLIVVPDFGGVVDSDKKNPFLPFGGTGRPGPGMRGHGR